MKRQTRARQLYQTIQVVLTIMAKIEVREDVLRKLAGKTVIITGG